MVRILTLSFFIASILSFSILAQAQSGCTDPLASNYNSSATINDGSCTYPVTSLAPTSKGRLSDTIHETSGLAYWNGMLWTHNDDGDTTLYAIDTLDGHIIRRVPIKGVINHDWEEITQDSAFFYIGDFGNNGNGDRKNLVVLKIAKADLSGSGAVSAQQIHFSYSDQTDFSGTGNNNTDFDCEAFVAAGDSLYLFTKQWVSRKSKIYALSKIPGTYSIHAKNEYNVDGLITGATWLANKRIVVLSGYKIAGLSMAPFVYLLYDYSGFEFFTGNKRRIELSSAFLQVEGIASFDGRRFFLSNEEFNNIIKIPAALMSIDISPYVTRWYQTVGVATLNRHTELLAFYPNPGTNQLYTSLVAKKPGKLTVSVYDSGARHLKDFTYNLKQGKNTIELTPEPAWVTGQYYFDLKWDEQIKRGRVELRK